MDDVGVVEWKLGRRVSGRRCRRYILDLGSAHEAARVDSCMLVSI